ncbi:sensor histidine kinase [Nonomuraea sp. NPDC050328]|uniref:sensor histidine kinase n=1 Tax=Nonomuraea sp. NPDC050328 TaxID=3364361 RepID=UPI0037963F2C
MRRLGVRLRFTLLLGGLFVLSGLGLLLVLFVLVLGPTRISHSVPAGVQPASAAQQRIEQLETEVSELREGQTRQLVVGAGVALLVMSVASVGLGRIAAGRVLRPLRTLTAGTRRISADNLHERLAVDGPADEVKDLADTIDDLLERLEGAFAAQRRFVANASHELRTPLATMRASIDVATAKPEPPPPQTLLLADRLRTELDQVDRLLDGLLTLARTQHQRGALPDRVPVSLADLLAEALAERSAAIADRALTVHVTTPDDQLGDGLVQGSPTLLAQLVGNVIDNAVRHNRPGGSIRAELRLRALVVENDGPRLDPAQVARLGHPFQRLGTDRVNSGGSGLGLSIVAAITSAHGGRLNLTARPEGGLRVEVTL